jgi:hypothetical protein
MVMVVNAIFNNISAMSWRSVSLVEKTRVPRENHPSAESHWQTLSHNVVSSSCKSKYHTIMTRTDPETSSKEDDKLQKSKSIDGYL